LGFKRGFKAEANRIAVRIRQQMGLDEKAPVDPFAICDRFDIRVIPLSAMDDRSYFLLRGKSEFSAVTVPCGLNTAIVHNNSHHPHRQRSNICHELAHCFLGHKHAPPLTEDGERSRDGGIEAEANFLAGCLLVTNEAALHILMNRMIIIVPNIYGISKSMLSYRLQVSGAQTIYKRINGLV